MTVTIGCKLPNGLLMGAQVGGKPTECRINGWNQNVIQGTEHGITHDVPKALWEAWLAENKDRGLVKKGFIFAHGSEKSVKAEAKEKKGNKSGQEQLAQLDKNAVEGAVGKVG